ncbi:HTH-type sugar sensing transcriptional regulator TrmB [Halomarina oriensis]|uniref:TrmB family transcriptional regulator n=1 Tax=Halomarina oriensis TaxID=671145 RepID=A0A6B0GN07_9EURY|nr:TrmB family transcriptional regulator [Halomarina oriensis]MWG36252.1 TrmB family transcriptional regulator [Halomarina oriensis]
MSSGDPRATLERLSGRFDFGEYESEAYLAILRHGELTASEIAEYTDIPQPRVYDTVRGLANVGLVELQESRPMRVLAVDPQEAFTDLRSSLDDLVEDLEREYTSPVRDSEAVTLVKSRSTILRYLADVIESAEYELVLSVSPDLVGRFEEELQERREAGVTIELLLSPAVDAPGPEEYDYARIATHTRARRGLTTPVVAVADGSYSVYATRDALRSDRDRYGVIFNRSELGFLVSGFLNTVVWTSATTVQHDDSRPAFPRRYATIRRCVSDLSATDGPFYASIVGRDVEGGASRTVHGEVVDVSVGTNRETAALTVDTGEGLVDVGGQVAALEDIEAREIHIGRSDPPGLDE